MLASGKASVIRTSMNREIMQELSIWFMVDQYGIDCKVQVGTGSVNVQDVTEAYAIGFSIFVFGRKVWPWTSSSSMPSSFIHGHTGRPSFSSVFSLTEWKTG